MKILSILLTNTMLASAIGFSNAQTSHTKSFAEKAENNWAQTLPFVEITFTLEDYEYIKKETGVETIIDYIIKSKKINIDKILEDPSVSIRLEEILPESTIGVALEKAKETIVEVIAKNIATQIHETYKKEVEIIVKKKSGWTQTTTTQPLSILNWLLTLEGTKTTLEWFKSEYGEKTTNDMPAFGQGKWEATLDYTNKALDYVKANDGELIKLFPDWEGLGGASDYAAKLAAFIAKSDLTTANQKALWSANNDVAQYLEAYNTWRTSTAAGKGQELLRTEWETKTDYSDKAKAYIKGVNAELVKLLDKWEKLGVDSDYATKLAAFIAKSDLTTANQKALWSANGDVAQYLEAYNTWRTSTAAGKGQELLRTEWETKTDYSDKAKAYIKGVNAELVKLLDKWEKLGVDSDYATKLAAFIAKSDLTTANQKALWSANNDVAQYLEAYNTWRKTSGPGNGEEILRAEWQKSKPQDAGAYVKSRDHELVKLLDKWEELGLGGASDYATKLAAFIAKSDLTAANKKALWSANGDVAQYLEAYNAWRTSTDPGKGQKTLRPLWEASKSSDANSGNNYEAAFNSWKTTKGRRDHEWKADTGASGGASKLSDFIANISDKSSILNAWKQDASNTGFDKKFDIWSAKVNQGQSGKTKNEWYWSDAFRKKADTWIQSLTKANVTDDLIKKAWYFSPDYLTKSASNKHADKTNADLDTWIDGNKAVGAEAIRYFVANNPGHAISKKFYDYWKTNGDNYAGALNDWASAINKKADGTTRVKPAKSIWLANGNDSWDTYKLWVDGPAAQDSATVAAVIAKDPSVASGALPTEADYKAATSTSNDKFKSWFNNLDSEKQDAIILKGYKTEETAKYNSDVANWGKNTRPVIWAVNTSISQITDKMKSSPPLYNLFKVYRNIKYKTLADRDKEQLNITTNNPKLKNALNWIKWDSTGATPSSPANQKAAAIDFANLYIKNQKDNPHSIILQYGGDKQWKKEWYDLNKSDLKWSDWDSRFYWLVDTKPDQETVLKPYVLSVNGDYQTQLATFNSTPYAEAFRLTPRTAAQTKLEVENVFAKQSTRVQLWMVNYVLNDTSKGVAPTSFTNWVNRFTPQYKTTDFNGYKASVNADANKKKEIGWDTYIKSADGQKDFDDWKKAQGVSIDVPKFKNTLLADWDSFNTHYNNHSASNTDYGAWQPWYIVGDEEFSAYARKGLELESGKFGFDSPFYLRYIYSKHKEHRLFEEGNTRAHMMAIVYDYLPWPIIFKAMNWSNTPFTQFSEFNTLATASSFDPAAKPEYQGGVAQRTAYTKGKQNFFSIDSGNNISQRKAVLDSLKTDADKRYILWDFSTKVMPYYWTELDTAEKGAYIKRNKLFNSEWLKSYSTSNLNAHFAFRDKFLDNTGSNRNVVAPFSDDDIIDEFKKLSEDEKNLIYTNTKYMTDASHDDARKTAFVAWAKDTTVRTSPILLDHYLNTDSLSKNHYEAWTPFRLFSESDYENIAKLTKAAMNPTAVGDPAKKTLEATADNIALIEYFTKTLAQKANKGIVMDNLDPKDGSKFWPVMWSYFAWPKMYNWQNSSPLWQNYYKHFGISTSDISSSNQDDLIRKDIIKEEWVQSPLIFEHFKWVIELMWAKGSAQLGGDYFADSTNKTKISKEIIDLDKSDAESPIDDYVAFTTSDDGKNAIWTNVFVKNVNNYKTDWETWQTSTFKTSSDADDVFNKWNKDIINGKAEYKKYYDLNAGEYSSWIPFTKTTEAEYNVIVPTWANTKTLWAKETYSTWGDPSSFKSWYDTKAPGGTVSPWLLGEYKKTSLKDARLKLDVDGNYSDAEMKAHIASDFTNKAWWLVEVFLADAQKAHQSDFDTWLTRHTPEAKTDLVAKIDAGTDSPFMGEVNKIYQAWLATSQQFETWSKNINNGKTFFNAHSYSNTQAAAWSPFTKTTKGEYDVIVPTWANTKTLWAKETYSTWGDPSSFKSWYDTKAPGGTVSPWLLVEYKKTSLKDARLKLDADGNYSDAEMKAHIANDFTNKAWWLVEVFLADAQKVHQSNFDTWLTISYTTTEAKTDLVAKIDAGTDSDFIDKLKDIYQPLQDAKNQFAIWNKDIANGKTLFMNHGDSDTQAAAWSPFTKTTKVEYDVIVPTWANTKTLWAKETYSTWGDPSSFKSWYDTKAPGGTVSPWLLGEYKKTSLKDARLKLDADSNYSDAEMKAHIASDFTNKAWWLVEVFLADAQKAHQSDFDTWLTTHTPEAKTDLVAKIDAGTDSDFIDKLKDIYQPLQDAKNQFAIWNKDIANGKTLFMNHGDSDTQAAAWSPFTKTTKVEYDVIVPTWANTKTLWAKETYSTWGDPSSFKSWYDTKAPGGTVSPWLLGEYKKTSLKDARLKLDADGNYSDAEMKAHIASDFTNKAWWLVEVFLADAQKVHQSDFDTWLTTHTPEAKTDLIAKIDNDSDNDLDSGIKAQYKANDASHLNGYKLWRDGLNKQYQAREHAKTADGRAHYNRYLRNYNG